jgi:hypothetical protein
VTLKKWNAQPDWREEYENLKQILVIKAPTNTIGTWIFLEKDQSGQKLTAVRISPHTKLKLSWSHSGCEGGIEEFVADKEVKPQADSATTISAFDDSQLKTLLEQRKPGLIYVFSPGMHLSLDGIESARIAANALHLDLTILIDPQFKNFAPAELEKRTHLNVRSIKWIDSNELYFRGMTTHYPSLIVYTQKGVLSEVFPGRKTEREYISFVKDVLK